jgi:hypothetical protein
MNSFPTAETLLWSLAAIMLAASVPTIAGLVSDPRTIDGYQSVWAKPLKFQLSLALHAATLALAASHLSPEPRFGSLALLASIACVAAGAFEVAYISAQAARQQLSHFNLSTPLFRTLYSLMALGAVMIIGAAAVFGALTAFDSSHRGSPALRAGIAIGFIVGTVLTLVTAFTIGGRLSPYVGAPPGTHRLPLTGWSLAGGDLRVSHFLATHMLQAVPAAAWILDRIASPALAMAGTLAFAALWSLWTILEYRTALAGEVSSLLAPFRPLPLP